MRWVFLYNFIFFVVYHVASLPDQREIDNKQGFLSKLLRETLALHGYIGSGDDSDEHRSSHLVSIPSCKSEIYRMCDRLQFNHYHDYDLFRFSCCAPTEVRHLYNVKIEDKKIIYYNKDKIEPNHHLRVPQIKSMRLQQAYHFNMDIEESESEFKISQCKSYFNGTIHVIGRGTVKNVYHSIADNFIPVVTQIMEDYMLDPEFLYLPRVQLMGFQPPDSSAVPHIKMIDKLMSAGSIDLDEADSMCFRRISWGHGTHIMYYDVQVHMRRLTADFTRKFIGASYQIPIPLPFQNITQTIMVRSSDIQDSLSSEKSAHRSSSNDYPPELFDVSMGNDSMPRRMMTENPFLIDGHPMRITLYTRGTSGRGRSIQGEDKLVDYLTKAGAVATICCDFSKTTMEDQIGYAYHADAVIGLHGAAIAHTIFAERGIISLELKTKYGYESILFNLISDARMGFHAQVDIRDHFITGGHRPIEAPLIERTSNALTEAILMRERHKDHFTSHHQHHHSHHHEQSNPLLVTKHHKQYTEEMKVLSKPGDFVSSYANDQDVLHHMLGPKNQDVKAICHNMIFAKVRRQLAAEEETHCADCNEIKR